METQATGPLQRPGEKRWPRIPEPRTKGGEHKSHNENSGLHTVGGRVICHTDTRGFYNVTFGIGRRQLLKHKLN